MTKERLLEFLEKHIFPKYKNHLIILDNAGSHNNELIKNAILKSGNDIINPDILHISYYEIEKKNHWKLLLPELIDKCNSLINNEVIRK